MTISTVSVNLEIESFRPSPTDRQWELPAWGHPLAQGVLPLFIIYEDRLIPVGTAFTIGRGVTFVVSAMHNVREAWKYEDRLSHLLFKDEMPKAVDLKQVQIGVLYQRQLPGDRIQITLWPLETLEGSPPTDIVFGYPQFQTAFPTLVHRLSFALPSVGLSVWSMGYSKFFFPEGGIPVADVRAGTFNWQRDYSHQLTVVEGKVERIFTQRFAKGFIEGPCFTFDAEIPHALSGGPVMSRVGIVRGVNAAGATHFFDSPKSIASLLYPILLQNVRFGASLGPIRINSNQPLLNLIAQGTIPTDGSEENSVTISQDPADSSLRVNSLAPIELTPYIHDDFPSLQKGKPSTKYTGDSYRIRRVDRTGQ